MIRVKDVDAAEKAKSAGLYRYFTGESCPRGHVAERYVSSGACVMCVKRRPWRIRRKGPKIHATVLLFLVLSLLSMGTQAPAQCPAPIASTTAPALGTATLVSPTPSAGAVLVPDTTNLVAPTPGGMTSPPPASSSTDCAPPPSVINGVCGADAATYCRPPVSNGRRSPGRGRGRGRASVQAAGPTRHAPHPWRPLLAQ